MLGEVQRQVHDWALIARHVPGRDRKACRQRWCRTLAAAVNTGHWTNDEDERLSTAVHACGKQWTQVAGLVRTRNGDQCLKRWCEVLDPQIDRRPWTEEEDASLLEAVTQCGRNWAQIATRYFPRRSASALRYREQTLRNKADQEKLKNTDRIVPPLFCNTVQQSLGNGQLIGTSTNVYRQSGLLLNSQSHASPLDFPTWNGLRY